MRPLDQPWESFLTHPCNYPPFHILCNWSYCDFLQSLRIRSRANLVEINFKNPDPTPKCWKNGCLQSNENTPFSKTSKICNEYPSCNFSKNWWPKGTFRTTTPKINNLYIILSIEDYFFYCSSAKWCSALLCSVHFNIKLQINAGECAAERCRRTSTQCVSQYTPHSTQSVSQAEKWKLSHGFLTSSSSLPNSWTSLISCRAPQNHWYICHLDKRKVKICCSFHSTDKL